MDTMAQERMGDRRVTLEHLRSFVAVAETGGFLEAGRLLHRTQSAVTQSVKRLEEYLRCRLLERGQGQNTALTGDGARLLPEAKDILLRLDQAVRLMQQPELKGHITLGIQPGENTEALQPVIASCMALNKGLRVQVLSEISSRLIEMLEHGLLDVVIVCRNKEEAVPEDTCRHLLRLESMVWAGSRVETFSAADEIPLVVSVETCSNREAAENALKTAGMRYYLSFVSPSWGGVCSAVAAGFGITVLGQSELGDRHVVLTEEHGLPSLPSMRTELRTKSQSPVIRQFCELIKGLPAFQGQA
ncbi:Transcriptional regulator, LysR family [uncultured delta proteobacterium]|uniref:Transcriptional regulator, LysR family n=1 Tax=uncultured delta proteobacterium TaxID=34034 RepID=A0A212J0C4_9DELT|nr:Transcriptional regulator, LysR family [uncultured delta proteobacterium]